MLRPPPMSITVMTTVAPASRPRPVAMSMKRTQPAAAGLLPAEPRQWPYWYGLALKGRLPLELSGRQKTAARLTLCVIANGPQRGAKGDDRPRKNPLDSLIKPA